jgi:hypothetical protein
MGLFFDNNKDSINHIYFFISLNDIDKTCYEDNKTNRFLDSLEYLNQLFNDPKIKSIPIDIIFTHKKLFGEKITKQNLFENIVYKKYSKFNLDFKDEGLVSQYIEDLITSMNNDSTFIRKLKFYYINDMTNKDESKKLLRGIGIKSKNDNIQETRKRAKSVRFLKTVVEKPVVEIKIESDLEVLSNSQITKLKFNSSNVEINQNEKIEKKNKSNNDLYDKNELELNNFKIVKEIEETEEIQNDVSIEVANINEIMKEFYSQNLNNHDDDDDDEIF